MQGIVVEMKVTVRVKVGLSDPSKPLTGEQLIEVRDGFTQSVPDKYVATVEDAYVEGELDFIDPIGDEFDYFDNEQEEGE